MGDGPPGNRRVHGGLYGLAAAAYAGQILYFVLGYFLYSRLGYSVRLLFMAHFDWRTIKETFRFGVFEMLGSASFTAGQAAEIVITTTFLINYNEIWGNWGLAQQLAGGSYVASTLFFNLIPAISESFSNARIKLSQYYAVMAMKWGGNDKWILYCGPVGRGGPVYPRRIGTGV